MVIVLKPGEKIEIQFYETDGQIDVEFSHDSIRVHTDWPDTSNRSGTLYEEKFSRSSFKHKHIVPVKKSIKG